MLILIENIRNCSYSNVQRCAINSLAPFQLNELFRISKDENIVFLSCSMACCVTDVKSECWCSLFPTHAHSSHKVASYFDKISSVLLETWIQLKSFASIHISIWCSSFKYYMYGIQKTSLEQLKHRMVVAYAEWLLYMADQKNDRIAKLASNGTILTTAINTNGVVKKSPLFSYLKTCRIRFIWAMKAIRKSICGPLVLRRPAWRTRMWLKVQR